MTCGACYEAPRVTKPYTDEQWSADRALGHAIDADLRADDVRLTMGGEPTFVSIDDPDGAEWNTAALGPTKRRAARRELLSAAAASNTRRAACVHFGQGKWYPGEQLPRWSLGCYWRRDGEPIWHDTALIADEQTDYGATRRRRASASCGRSPRSSACTTAFVFAGLRGRLGTTCGASAGCR